MEAVDVVDLMVVAEHIVVVDSVDVVDLMVVAEHIVVADSVEDNVVDVDARTVTDKLVLPLVD